MIAMCNARITFQISPSLLQGPASDAVERCCSKRLRSYRTPAKTFNLDGLFHTVCEEAFPSIGWDLESNSDKSFSSMCSSFSDYMCYSDEGDDEFESHPNKKRARCGMVRSISIMTDLALLEPASEDFIAEIETSAMQDKNLDVIAGHHQLRTPLGASKHVSVTARAS